jgi:hypothetical protein
MQLHADGFKAKALHGDLTQKQRDEAMSHFREGRLHVLVATDIASRGLDVFDVSHVINYDLPEDHLTYVHRIGRTGRMGAAGEAITFVFPDQASLMSEWAKTIGTTITELRLDGLPSPEAGAMGSMTGGMQPMGYGAASPNAAIGPGGAYGQGRSSHSSFGSQVGRSLHERSGGAGGPPFGHGGGGRTREGGRPAGGGFGGRSREGGPSRSGRDGGSREGGRSGGFGHGGGRGRDGPGGGFDQGSGMGRASVSPMTIKKIRERPIGAAKSHGSTRGGHQYAGRQS